MITLEHPLDEASRAFLKSVEEFAQKEVAPFADEWDDDEKLPREIFTKAGKIGLMGMIAPKEFGGRGLSYVTAAFAIKELGKVFAALSMDIAAHNSLAVGQINQFGTVEQKQKYLPKLTSGEWLGAWALTEPNAGSDTGGIETRGQENGDHWQINGLKKFITSGRTADLLVVMATTGKTETGKNEISAFIMMKDQVTPVRKIHTYGMRASDTANCVLKTQRQNSSARAGAAANRRFQFWIADALASLPLRSGSRRRPLTARIPMLTNGNNSVIRSAIFRRCNGCWSIPQWNWRPRKY
jgi:alkylation response protein AidB-like acyl-CoA dehydrogenase